YRGVLFVAARSAARLGWCGGWREVSAAHFTPATTPTQTRRMRCTKELSAMRHLIRRICFYLVALWASVSLNFWVPRLAPGNPAESLLLRFERKGPVSPEALKALQAAFGI